MADVGSLVAEHGIRPLLATILVGNNPASAIYVKRKAALAERAAIRSLRFERPADTDTASLLELIVDLDMDPDVDGVRATLPAHPY